MKDLIEYLEPVLLMMFLFIFLCGFVLGLVTWLGSVDCQQFGQQVGNTTVYRVPSGCYVQIDGNWIPSDNYWQYVRYESLGEK